MCLWLGKKEGKFLWVGVKVWGPSGLTPNPHLHQLTREAGPGPGQRPSPGLNKKLLPLVLHQVHVLTDLLEGHLWYRTGQWAAGVGPGRGPRSQCSQKGQVGRQKTTMRA